MENQQSKLIRMLKLWLRKNELDGDTKFYTIDEWKARDEPYHNDAEFVIVTEGGLNFVLNYGDSTEFYDLINSFGYYCELGHSWNLGFYVDEIENEVTQTSKTYSAKLKDKRWQEKRRHVLERADYKCEDCSSTLQLEIHHCYYLYGFEPWEYPYDALRCLCNSCHKRRGQVEQILRGHLASLTIDELEALIKMITSGVYWYPREDVFSLISSFRHDQTETKEIFSRLLTRRTTN
jgi:hypothetical protein